MSGFIGCLPKVAGSIVLEPELQAQGQIHAPKY